MSVKIVRFRYLKNRLMVISTVLIAIVTVCIFEKDLIASFLNQDNRNLRNVKFQKNFLQSQFTSKGIINRTLQLQLKFKTVDLNSEPTKIEAAVSLPFDFNEKLYFKWKLGEGVVALENKISGELNGILKNEIKNISLSVTGFGKETNHQIGFEIYGVKNGKKIYADAVVSSNIEQTFENIVQNVEKIKKQNKD